jgi:hypothetical protein
MEKLDTNEISVDQAKAQANLAKQANNSLKYELDRVATQMRVEAHNREFNSSLVLREAESKNFES